MAGKPKTPPNPELEGLRVQLEAAEAAPEAAALPAPLTFKPMFGGILAYVDGKPVASLSNIGLALKLAPADQDALLALPGAKRLRYEPDAPESKTYVVVPPELCADPSQLAEWLIKSAAAAVMSKKK